MKIRFLILLLACFLLNSTCYSASLLFNLSGLPVVSSMFNGEIVTEVFVPETEGGGPGGSVAIITDGVPTPTKTKPAKVSYQYYYSENRIKVEFVTHLKDKDQISCAEIVNAKIGDTFKGISGTTYVLREQKILNEKQLQHLTNKGIVVVGEWVEYSGDENIGGFTQGPFYITKDDVTYKYYIGYVPPVPPDPLITNPSPGGWIVTYMEPIN